MSGRVQRKMLGLAQRVPEFRHILPFDPGELTQVCMEESYIVTHIGRDTERTKGLRKPTGKG